MKIPEILGAVIKAVPSIINFIRERWSRKARKEERERTDEEMDWLEDHARYRERYRDKLHKDGDANENGV